MSTLKSVATAVVDDMGSASGQTSGQGAGTFIQIIEQIIQALLPMLAGCIPAAAEQTKALNRPSAIYKLELRRIVKQNSDKSAPRAVMFQSLLNVGKTLTVDQVTALQAGS